MNDVFNRNWSDKQELALRKYWRKKTIEEISEIIHQPVVSVKYMIKRLRLGQGDPVKGTLQWYLCRLWA